MHREQAQALLDGIERVRDEARKDKRATASYWNGDDWGGLSGQRDAASWVNEQVLEFIMRETK